MSTTVEGMTEQQIIFKSCFLNQADIIDGMTQTQFEENFKQELLETVLCLDKSYYMQDERNSSIFVLVEISTVQINGNR